MNLNILLQVEDNCSISDFKFSLLVEKYCKNQVSKKSKKSKKNQKNEKSN